MANTNVIFHNDLPIACSPGDVNARQNMVTFARETYATHNSKIYGYNYDVSRHRFTDEELTQADKKFNVLCFGDEQERSIKVFTVVMQPAWFSKICTPVVDLGVCSIIRFVSVPTWQGSKSTGTVSQPMNIPNINGSSTTTTNVSLSPQPLLKAQLQQQQQQQHQQYVQRIPDDLRQELAQRVKEMFNNSPRSL